MPPVETQQTPAKPPEKSRNLVADLIDTEKEYVENLKVLLQVRRCISKCDFYVLKYKSDIYADINE